MAHMPSPLDRERHEGPHWWSVANERIHDKQGLFIYIYIYAVIP